MNRPRTILVGLAALLIASPLLNAAEGKQPVKVFVLAGQSNMEGFGSIQDLDKDGDPRKGTLRYLLNDPEKCAMFQHLRDKRPAPASETTALAVDNALFGDPAPNIRKRLQLVYTVQGRRFERTVEEGETWTVAAKPDELAIEKAVYGDLPDGGKSDVAETIRKIVRSARSATHWSVRDDVWVWFNGRKGGLTTGFGAGKDRFGLELQFGHVLGDYLDNQVLLIKTAWGGKSLYKDFRPPSAGGEVGPCYRQLLETVDRVLTNLKEEFPGYDGGGYELSGLVWWHGWNDGCDPKNSVPEYERNLVNLIKDLRRDLRAPGLPVVVGELTGPWVKAGGEWAALRQAQADAADPARHPEFRGNVRFVATHDFVRPEEESPGGWPCHEFNNAETYFLVGNACGEAMKQLLQANAPVRRP